MWSPSATVDCLGIPMKVSGVLCHSRWTISPPGFVEHVDGPDHLVVVVKALQMRSIYEMRPQRNMRNRFGNAPPGPELRLLRVDYQVVLVSVRWTQVSGRVALPTPLCPDQTLHRVHPASSAGTTWVPQRARVTIVHTSLLSHRICGGIACGHLIPCGVSPREGSGTPSSE